jgi:hypothetical protein
VKRWVPGLGPVGKLSTHQLCCQFFAGHSPLLCLSLKLLHFLLTQLDLFDRHGASFGPSGHVLFACILDGKSSKLRFQQVAAQNGSLCAVELRQSLDQLERVFINTNLDFSVV